MEVSSIPQRLLLSPYHQLMESLALLASLILAIAVIGGPLSLLFAILRGRNKRSNLQSHTVAQRVYAILILTFGLPALVVGLRLTTLDIAMGGKFFGLIGVATSFWALLRLFRSRSR